MIVRFSGVLLALSLTTGTSALAQATAPAAATRQPQVPPNPGAAEASPSTIKGPGGYTTEPAAGSQATPATYGGDPSNGNDFTASPPLGPQRRLGDKLNRTVHYVTGDAMAPPRIFNAFSAGNKGNNGRSATARGVFELPIGRYDAYLGGDARRYVYPTTAGPVTGIGPIGRSVTNAVQGNDYDADARFGVKLAGPRVFAAVSYLFRGTTTAEPRTRGLGYGVEKLADVDQNVSLHGNVFFYPNVGGAYRVPADLGQGSRDDSYRVFRYALGLSLQPNHSPVFLDAGFLGDRGAPRTDAPTGFNHQGPYIGLGFHF